MARREMKRMVGCGGFGHMGEVGTALGGALGGLALRWVG
jgi:hypothetical protein